MLYAVLLCESECIAHNINAYTLLYTHIVPEALCYSVIYFDGLMFESKDIKRVIKNCFVIVLVYCKKKIFLNFLNSTVKYYIYKISYFMIIIIYIQYIHFNQIVQLQRSTANLELFLNCILS